MAQTEPATETSEAQDTSTPTVPPNLRAAESEDKECGNCARFKGGAHCTKYPPLCVSDEWVCSGWEAGGKDTTPEKPEAAPERSAPPRSKLTAARMEVLRQARSAR